MRSWFLVALVFFVPLEILAIRTLLLGVAEDGLMGVSSLLGVPYNTLVVLVGTSVLGLASGLVGAFGVLRGRALLGDAVAHGALPGLCLAFLLVGGRSFEALLLGAIASGLVGVGVVVWIRHETRVKDDAAIGFVLSVFFAFGIALSGIIQGRPDAQQAGLDTYLFGKTSGMVGQDVLFIALVALNVIVILEVFRKEFTLLSFDRDYAAIQGLPVRNLDLLLMGLLVVATVIGLPAVGVVLMAGMLIIPSVSARFWTDDFARMMQLSGLFGMTTGLIGTMVSATFTNVPAGPVIILTGAAIFLVSMTVAPRRGVMARLLEQWRFRQKVDDQNLLRSCFELGEARGTFELPIERRDLRQTRGWTLRRLRGALLRATESGLLRAVGPGAWVLTERGIAEASEIVRRHRLWELFLVNHADIAQDHVDRDADEIEHVLDQQLVAELERGLIDGGNWPEPAVPQSVHS